MKIENLARLQKKLRAMPIKAKENMLESLRKGAAQILEAQRTLAERSRRSGELIRGLEVKPGDHELQLKVVSEAFYSRFVEFGTVKMPAEPFFFAGYRLMRRKVKAAQRTAARKAAREAARV